MRSSYNFSLLSNKVSDSIQTPKAIYEYLQKYIISQNKAKIVLSNAFRNRWRRLQLSKEAQAEVFPKNILIKGPTGSGKTELARKLVKLNNSPFIKVDATNYTEVGYHGKDVETIIQDLVVLTEKRINDELISSKKALESDIENYIDLLIIDLLLGDNFKSNEIIKSKLKKLKQGLFDDFNVQIRLKIFNGLISTDKYTSLEQFTDVLKNMSLNNNPGDPKITVKIKDLKINLKQKFYNEFVNNFDRTAASIAKIENSGVIFIDEIDKIANAKSVSYSRGPSTDGVQRDLLPIIEGTNVSTKMGNVNTKNILFICAGAFSNTKPEDLLPELLGRLPIRIELKNLNKEDFKNILTKLEYNLITQHQLLLESENIVIELEEKAIDYICSIAEELNFTKENLGTRRLHSLIEKIFEDISFELKDFEHEYVIKESLDNGQIKFKLTEDYIKNNLKEIAKKVDYSKYLM